jgi:uncharacterized membrane protein
MNITLVFAILSGVSVAAYSIFQKLGSTNINPALGAMIVSTVAFFINLLVLFGMKIKDQAILFTSKGLWLLILVGIAAAGVDLFGLLAYSKGLKITSSFIIGGVQTAIILMFGFLALKEPFSLGRLIGIGLIIAGTLLLHRYGI